MELKFSSRVTDDGVELQIMDDMCRVISREFVLFKEHAVKDALISAGWTPPNADKLAGSDGAPKTDIDFINDILKDHNARLEALERKSTNPDKLMRREPEAEVVRRRYKCECCKKDEVKRIAGVEPYSEDHWQCPCCDSTYGLSQYPKVVYDNSAWISAKERLPASHEKVLCLIAHGDIRIMYREQCKWYEDGDSYGKDLDMVLYWMPLSEPPEVGK